MLFSLDKMFLFLAIIALPNLYYFAQYNVPLMLFCFSIWSVNYIPLIMYLLLFSWFVDCFRLFSQISHGSKEKYEKQTLVLVLMICLFALKIICIILLAVFNINCRNALHPENMGENFKETFFPGREEVKEDEDD